MNNFFLSSFNTKIIKNSQNFIYNSITNQRILDTTLLSDLLDRLLLQQLDSIESSNEGKILQLIVAELLNKGIIIPINQKERESDYLNSLINFNTLPATFFRCSSLTESKLALFESKDNNRIIFCSIPYDFGAGNPGTRFGPKMLKNASEAMTFRSKNNILLDLEDKLNFPYQKEIYDIGDINLQLDLKSNSLAKIKNLVSSIYEKSLPFFVGGDHMFSLPIIESIYSCRKKPFTVVQLDYHLDVQLWGDFKSNRPDILTEVTHANFISWIKFKMPELDIFQVGVYNYSSIDSTTSPKSVYAYLRDIGTQISNTEILNSTKEEIINKLPLGQDIYLTIDVDVLNRIYIPNTGYPSPLGMSISDFYNIVINLCKRNNVIGVDIMEFGSSDHNDQSSMCEIILTLILQIIKNI